MMTVSQLIALARMVESCLLQFRQGRDRAGRQHDTWYLVGGHKGNPDG
jgi:hypothetical protein